MSDHKPRSKKKLIFILLFVLLNAGVILWTALDAFSGNSDAVKFRDLEVRWIMLLPATGCWLGAILMETIKYLIVLRRAEGHTKLSLCIRTVLLGRYYDNITPSGVGGQPFQILYLTQNGVAGTNASVTTITAFLSMQFGFVILALVTFLSPFGQTSIDVIQITRYIGLVFYAFFPFMILFFTFLPKLSGTILAWFVRLGYRMHLVKNCQETESKVKNAMASYSSAIFKVIASPVTCIPVMLLGILYHAALCCIPYFVVRAFGGGMGFVECFVNTLSIYAAITFIPTPGNGGAAEGSFYIVFSTLTTGYTFWAMLTWRFFTFYVFILFGLLIYLERYIRGQIAKKRAKA